MKFEEVLKKLKLNLKQSKSLDNIVVAVVFGLILVMGMFVLKFFVGGKMQRNNFVADLPQEVVAPQVGVNKKQISQDLWTSLSKSVKLPSGLSIYIDGVTYEGVTIYFGDLVDIYKDLFQKLPDELDNNSANWTQVLAEAKRQLVVIQLARELGLVDLAKNWEFDHNLYLQIYNYLANKYVIKSWEIEINADSEISSDQVGEALINLVPRVNELNTDEDFTQAVLGLFGDWGVATSDVKAYVQTKEVAIWADENYTRLLSSLISGKSGDWSSVIEIPSEAGRVRYVIGEIKSVGLANNELDNFVKTRINQFPDLEI